MLGSAVGATRGGCELSVRLLESRNVEIWGGTARPIVRGLETTPVGDYSGAVTSSSEGAEEVSMCLGHLPAEGRDLMLRCCAGLAERGLGIGQLGLQKPLRSGMAECVLTFQICKRGSGSTSVSVAGGAPGAVELMAMRGCCRPAEGLNEIRRLLVVGEIGCKVLRLQHGGSGMGDLHHARTGESLEVQHEEKSIIQCDDRFPISAGNAERSGWREGYGLHEVVLCGRCSSKLQGDGHCYFFEEEEVKGDTPRELQGDWVLHSSESQSRDRGNKIDSLRLEGCISMSSGVAVKEFLVVVDNSEEQTFEVSGGEISDVSAEEYDDHDVASGCRTHVEEFEENLVICCLISVEITPGVLLIRSGETLSSLTCRGDQPAESRYLVTKARESSAGLEALVQAPSGSQRLQFRCDTDLSCIRK